MLSAALPTLCLCLKILTQAAAEDRYQHGKSLIRQQIHEHAAHVDFAGHLRVESTPSTESPSNVLAAVGANVGVLSAEHAPDGFGLHGLKTITRIRDVVGQPGRVLSEDHSADHVGSKQTVRKFSATARRTEPHDEWRGDALWLRIAMVTSAWEPLQSKSSHLLLTVIDKSFRARFQDLLTRPFYSPLVVLALDQETHTYFSIHNSLSLLMPAADIKTSIMRAKTEVTLGFLEANWTVIFFEGDVFCRRDPASLLTNHDIFSPDGSTDFAISSHPGGREDTDEINIGFFIARPTPRARHTLDTIARWWHKPTRAPNCCGPTEDQCVWDFAIRQARNGSSRIGGRMLEKSWYNSCEKWPDIEDLRIQDPSSWARIPIEFVDGRGTPVPGQGICAHLFVVAPIRRIKEGLPWEATLIKMSEGPATAAKRSMSTYESLPHHFLDWLSS